jgi:hypothetical protein
MSQLIYFLSTASVFSSTEFVTYVDNWSVIPSVTVTTATDIPPTTYANVVHEVGWHIQGTNTLTGYTSNLFTSTTITVYVQTVTNAGVSSSVIDPLTGDVLISDNYIRGSTGFSLGADNVNTATLGQVLGWVVNADYGNYVSIRDSFTTTICTTILEQSQTAVTTANDPVRGIPQFKITNTAPGAQSTSTYLY